MVSRTYVWLTLFLAAFMTWSALAGSLPFDTESDLPYRIRADALSYDDATKTYAARGHVTITRGNMSLQADGVTLNDETKEASAWGDVRFSSEEDWLTGSSIEVNLETGVGTVYDGTFFVHEYHFYIRGDEIRKTGKDSYYVKKGRFTACDGESPDWEIRGEHLRLTMEGYGTARDLTFRAKSIPLVYAPFFVFPAKTQRQTGLLAPQIGYSDRNGFEYSQPVFWAINESTDATFYEHYMADRGFKQGVEYRYVLSSSSRGTAMFDYLHDRKIDDCVSQEDSRTCDFEGFAGDDEDRTNRDRWWLRLKTDQELPAKFKAKLDVDVVSDQDYLREFYSGYSGYKEADRYFLKEFGRDLDDRTETIRRNQLNFNRIWGAYSLNTDMRWYDDVIIRKNNDPDPTLQMLPRVQMASSRQDLGDIPLYLGLESSYDYFWRDVGTKGHRIDLHPRLYYPVAVLKYLDFEPSVGIRETVWQAEGYEDEEPTGDDSEYRTVCDFKADLSTEFSKVFDVRGQSVDKIKHAMRPQVVYGYVPVPDQDDYPRFEGIDRIEEQNLLIYSITNYFTAKRTRPRATETDEQEPIQRSYYDDFCRIKFWQSYDIGEARGHTESGKERPFSDIVSEVEFRLLQYVDLDADVAWSPYDGKFTRYNGLLALSDDRGNSASVDYRYSKETSKSILAWVNVKLLDPLSAYGGFERNLDEGEGVETSLGFKYESQCWSLRAGYNYDRAIDSHDYLFEINLHGLGKVGG